MQWNRKRIDADAEESRARGQGGAYIVMNDGDRVVGRFMPVEVPADGAEAELYVRMGQHYLKQRELYVVCLKEKVVADFVPKGWTCEICDLWKDLRDSRDVEDQEEAKKYNVSVRFLSNFKLADGPMRIFRYSVRTQPKLVDLAFGTEYGDILDLKDGRDVEIKRKGASLDTDYSITPVKGTRTIPGSALDELHDLYGEIRVLEPKKIGEILKGGDPVEDEYITLRELMSAKASMGRKFDVASADDIRASVASAKTGRKSRARTQEAPEAGTKASPDVARKPTRAEAKMLVGFGEELDLDVDTDHPYADVVAAIVKEAVGSQTKKLSENLSDWLVANGCDVGGRLVRMAEAGASAEPAEEHEESEIERQIRLVRERRQQQKK